MVSLGEINKFLFFIETKTTFLYCWFCALWCFQVIDNSIIFITTVLLWDKSAIVVAHLCYRNIWGAQSQESKGANAMQITCDQFHNGHSWSAFMWFKPRWPESMTHFTRNWHEGFQTERISIRNLLCGRFDTQIKVMARPRSQDLLRHWSFCSEASSRSFQTVC